MKRVYIRTTPANLWLSTGIMLLDALSSPQLKARVIHDPVMKTIFVVCIQEGYPYRQGDGILALTN